MRTRFFGRIAIFTSGFLVFALIAGQMLTAAPARMSAAPLRQCPQPIITPVSGAYSTTQTVSISDSQPGATIHYTTDGAVPTPSSPVYSGSFPVSTSTVVKAIAVASGFSNSLPTWSAYTFEPFSTEATLEVTGPDPYDMSCSISGRAIDGIAGPSGTVTFLEFVENDTRTLGTADLRSSTQSRGFVPVSSAWSSAWNPGADVMIGDFNGDGIPDIVSLRFSQFLAGNGDGTFRAPMTINVPAGWYSAVGDFNGDGKLDVATEVSDAQGVQVEGFLGNGDGTFSEPAKTQISSGGALLAGRFTGGPSTDLVIWDNDGKPGIWLSNGDGSFTFGRSLLSSVIPGELVATSLRGNGRDDLVGWVTARPGEGNKTLEVWLSNGDGSFADPWSYPSSLTAGTIVPGMFNNDGHMDLALAGSKVSMLLGNGDGTFQNGYSTFSLPNRSQLAGPTFVGHFDGTPNLGLAIFLSEPHYQYSVAIFNGDGNGTLQQPMVYPIGWVSQAAFDVNNDGYTDFIKGGFNWAYAPSGLAVFLNGTIGSASGSIANIAVDATTDGNTLSCSYAGDASYSASHSNGVSNTYTQLPAPEFSLRVGEFTGPQTVYISAPLGPSGAPLGRFRYTTDGSTPTINSALYSGPFVISTTTTVKAITVATGYLDSVVSEAVYTFAATPEFSPPPGQYSSAQTVTITDSTSGSTIFYTTDGSTPTPLSATYTAPVALPANATLKAMAIAPRHLNSSAASGTYSAPAQTTTTALKASAISVAIGASVTLTATVTGSSPTGSVTFMAGSKALGTVTVSKGAAALKTMFSTAGTYAITANYSGDANNASSSSAAVSITVTAPTPTYTVSATPASQSITAGQSATYKITVTPANGYSASTSFDCSGAPSEAKCSFSPASVAPNGGPVSTTLTISTTAPQAMLDRRPGKDGPPWRPVGSLALAGLVGLFFAPRRARRWRALLRALSCMLLLVSAAMAVTGCGGGNTGGGQKDAGTPKGSYSVTVNASGTSNQSLKLTLVVK